MTASPGPVTYLGPSGTFTHQAVVELRPGAEARPVDSADEALTAVARGSAVTAVLPIDNSVNGVVVPTLDGLLQRPELSIVDSIVLPISFDAFVRDPDVVAERVVSHPHALAQCREWIDGRHLPVREASSTAAACRDLASGEVGLGPAICGELYGLSVLQRAVEDNAHAYTQFALVSASPLPVEGEGDDGLLVTLLPDANVPGILRQLLGVLEERGINMTNLVTRPVVATPGLYQFLLFLSGHFTAEDFAEMRDAWAQLGGRARAVGRISPLHELAGRR